MKIICPACAAAYEVPEGRLAPGRIVRCSRCDTDWAPIAADEPDPEPPPVPEPEPEPPPPEPAPVVIPVLPPPPRPPEPEPPQRNLGLLAAWVLSIALLAGGIWYAYAARDSVMRHWAPSARVYGLLGLAAPTRAP